MPIIPIKRVRENNAILKYRIYRTPSKYPMSIRRNKWTVASYAGLIHARVPTWDMALLFVRIELRFEEMAKRVGWNWPSHIYDFKF